MGRDCACRAVACPPPEVGKQLLPPPLGTAWLDRTARPRPAGNVSRDRRRLATRPDPSAQWAKPLEESWRAIVFDLPETQRKDRQRLWKALRAHKRGLLQRSVWIWPQPLEPILEQIIAAEGVPECFCGLETRRVFLCTDSELVATAWDFEEIGRRHRAYLEQPSATVAALQKADHVGRLAAEARTEWLAYEHAFSLDPWLPRSLWPPGYRGELVQRRHVAFRQCFYQRLQDLTVAGNSGF